ncbi:MAG: hypothetical protein HPY85_14665 [Anaerolineae bacterium]|nr:hypothetical protein [Anaerolineae bacterium]
MDEGALGLLVTAAPFVLCLGGVLLGMVGVVAWLLLKGKGQYHQLLRHLRQAERVPIGQLGGRSGLVQISGVIQQAADSFGVLNTAPLAMLRLQISGMKEEDGRGRRGPLEGKEKAVPFLLVDGTGSVWINPVPLDHRVMGKSRPAAADEAEEACALLAIDLPGLQRWSAPDTYEIWSWEIGQPLTVVGEVKATADGRPTVGRIAAHPMIVSPLPADTLADNIAAAARKAGKVSTIVVFGLMGLVLFVVCCIGMTIVQMLKG